MIFHFRWVYHYIIRDSENVNDNRNQKSFFQNAKSLVKHRLDLMIFLKAITQAYASVAYAST